MQRREEEGVIHNSTVVHNNEAEIADLFSTLLHTVEKKGMAVEDVGGYAPLFWVAPAHSHWNLFSSTRQQVIHNLVDKICEWEFC